MVCRTILRPSCTTRLQLSPKMANLPYVISLTCKARLLMWCSVMETHSRRMPCTSVAVSKYCYYCILCCKFHLSCISFEIIFSVRISFCDAPVDSVLLLLYHSNCYLEKLNFRSDYPFYSASFFLQL